MNLFGKFPLVRLKQFRDNPKYIGHYLKRLFYYKYTSHVYIPYYKNINFLSPKETLDYLIDNNASIARFGDGDIEILTGAGIYPPDSNWSQKASKQFIFRLKEVLSSDHPKLLLATISPSIFLCREDEAERNGIFYNMWTDARMILHKYLLPGKSYGDANVFISLHHKNFDWKKLYDYLRDRDVVVVTGTVSSLFGVSLGKRMFFVEAGQHNAFERYKEIRSSLMNLIELEGLKKENTLIMASLGPTADILAFDLTKEGWQVWDTGHFFKYTDKKFLEIEDKSPVFTKQLQVNNQKETGDIFEKNTKLYKVSLAVEGLKMPQPLSYTSTTICYEKLALPPLFCNVLNNNHTWSQDWFARIGQALGGLHKEVMGGSEVGIIHGDFFTHNIALDDNSIVFFDADPPSIRMEMSEHIENSRYMDIASFLISSCLSSGLKNQYKLWRHKKVFLKEFISSYEHASGFMLDKSLLRKRIDLELCRLYKWQASYGNKKSVSYFKYLLSRCVIRWQMRYDD